MLIWFRVLLFVLGACLGSFLCCQVRRLRLKDQALEKAKFKTKVKAKSTHQTKKNQASLGSRSVCLRCGRQLSWYENIPIFSWAFLRGRCHHCHTKIGRLEIVAELFMALTFLLISFDFSPTAATPDQWFHLVTMLVLVTILGFLALYDAAYGELPTFALIFAIICAAIILVHQQCLTFAAAGFSPELILAPLGSVAILGGIYILLYLVSRGQWVGDGDWILGISLGLALASPWLALITLFLANFLACLYALPTVLKNSRHRTKKHAAPAALRIPLGPFLIAAFIITSTFSEYLAL